RTYETGASIIHSANDYFKNFTDLLQLARKDPSDSTTGLWNGQRMAFRTHSWSLRTSAALLWRYGLSLPRLQSLVKATLTKFKQIYALQAEGEAFETPEELWAAVGLLSLTRRNLSEHLREALGGPTRLEDELVFAINKCNYNQGNELNALAGVVGLCPAFGGSVFQVEGGNSLVPKGLLRLSEANVRLGVRVAKVTQAGPGQPFALLSPFHEDLGQYDAVVVAAPLALAAVEFDVRSSPDGAPLPPPALPPQGYQTTHATFVQGAVNLATFGATSQDAVPGSVLLTVAGAAAEEWSSIAEHVRLESVEGRPGVFKVFSVSALSAKVLGRLFAPGHEVVHHEEWNAYPILTPLAGPFAKAVLYPGRPIYYSNSLEGGVSALEISAIAAKNAALLLARDVDARRRFEGGAEEPSKAATDAAV
ncbi:unnamed protein product, partial [Phaeothamnion confervicola]